MYGADGRFDRTWTPPIVSGAFPNISAFTYLDAEVIAGYYSASDSLPARVALFRGNEIIRVDSLLMGQSEENGVAGVNDIADDIGIERWGIGCCSDKRQRWPMRLFIRLEILIFGI